MVTEDNEILTKAARAKEKTEEAQKREENILSQTEFYIVGEKEIGK